MDSKLDPLEVIVAFAIIAANDELRGRFIDAINAQAEMFRRNIANAMGRGIGES